MKMPKSAKIQNVDRFFDRYDPESEEFYVEGYRFAKAGQVIEYAHRTWDMTYREAYSFVKRLCSAAGVSYQEVVTA